MKRRVGLAGALLPLAIIGCGSGHGSGSGNGLHDAGCSPGTSYTCSGPNACDGVRFCSSSGQLSKCDCTTTGTTPLGDAGLRDAGPVATQPADSGTSADASVAAQPDAGAHPGSDAGAPDGAARVVEDCGNGVDDDGDGKIDCADEDCSARTCLAVAPDGWSGPAVLYVGSEKAPACSGDYASEALRGGVDVSAPAAECSACSCSQLAPGCSTFLGFGAGAQADCSDAACKAEIDSSCVELSSTCLTGITTGYVQTELPPGANGCTPSAQSPVISDPSFGQHVLACTASELRRGGCGPGNLCAPQGPFAGPFCIVQAGDLACPAGPYSDKRVYFTAIDDSRDCSACACGTDCSYTWKVFDDADTSCQTPLATKTSAGECVIVTPSSGKVRFGVAISGAGTCTPNGGQPTGSATTSGPVTACCMP